MKSINEEYFQSQIKGLDEKFTLLLGEAEKRNGQRFDAQQMAVKTAMDAAEKAVTAAMAAAEKAVTKAEVAADKRLDGLNELRQMALDWKSEFARQTTVDLQIKGLSDKNDGIEKQIATLQGRALALAGFGALFGGAVGALIVRLSS